MRLLFLILFFFTAATAGICQHAVKVQSDSTGNTSAIYLPGIDADKDLYQRGSDNFFFVYGTGDRSGTILRAVQSGWNNLIFSVPGNQTGEATQLLRQKGSSNRIEIYRETERDSLSKKRAKVNIEQKGRGNSVTIIRENR